MLISVGAQAGLVFDETPIWSSLSLEGTYVHGDILPI